MARHHWQTLLKVQNILSFHRRGWIWADFCYTNSSSQDKCNFLKKNCHSLAWYLATCKNFWSCVYSLFLFRSPFWPKLSLLSLYRQWLPRYRPIFKVPYFEITKIPKVAQAQSFYEMAEIVQENLAPCRSSRSCTYQLFLPQGTNWSYFPFTSSDFRDIVNFENRL